MKFKEIVSHLINGGKVIVIGSGRNPKLSLNQLIKCYHVEDMLNLDYEIVKEPIYFECNVEVYSHTGKYKSAVYVHESLLPDNFEEEKKYNIKFEEIK